MLPEWCPYSFPLRNVGSFTNSETTSHVIIICLPFAQCNVSSWKGNYISSWSHYSDSLVNSRYSFGTVPCFVSPLVNDPISSERFPLDPPSSCRIRRHSLFLELARLLWDFPDDFRWSIFHISCPLSFRYFRVHVPLSTSLCSTER